MNLTCWGLSSPAGTALACRQRLVCTGRPPHWGHPVADYSIAFALYLLREEQLDQVREQVKGVKRVASTHTHPT